MPRALVATGMELEHDTFGSPDDPTLLLVMGFTAQMIQWDERFCQMLADTGLYVVRYDNRDCGLSTKLDGVAVDTGAVMTAALRRRRAAAGAVHAVRHGCRRHRPARPPRCGACARDGRLDGRDDRADHGDRAPDPGRVGHLGHEHHRRPVGRPGRARGARCAALSPPATTREAYIDESPKWMAWHSKKHRNAERTKELAAIGWDRSNYGEGGPRQMAAIVASGDRTERLRQLDVPALVIHGRDDTLITPSGGFATADAIPGAPAVPGRHGSRPPRAAVAHHRGRRRRAHPPAT
ncbi:MAG: alpha/beta hydrolase [Ilumatobacteraceae bacterium]